jgi:hypothetical protein
MQVSAVLSFITGCIHLGSHSSDLHCTSHHSYRLLSSSSREVFRKNVEWQGAAGMHLCVIQAHFVDTAMSRQCTS